MEDPTEHALVVKALNDGLGNCVVWDERAAKLVIEQHHFNPVDIRRGIIRHVKSQGGDVVVQRNEDRHYWRDLYRFYYMVILPYSVLRHGLFVEMRLTDGDDLDFPEVTLVGAHPQLK